MEAVSRFASYIASALIAMNVKVAAAGTDTLSDLRKAFILVLRGNLGSQWTALPKLESPAAGKWTPELHREEM
jgi:hypothetical protein